MFSTSVWRCALYQHRTIARTCFSGLGQQRNVTQFSELYMSKETWNTVYFIIVYHCFCAHYASNDGVTSPPLQHIHIFLLLLFENSWWTLVYLGIPNISLKKEILSWSLQIPPAFSSVFFMNVMLWIIEAPLSPRAVTQKCD